ncbi:MULTISPECIES: transposase [Virgibacillus]
MQYMIYIILKYHVIWVTKYRYKVLRGEIAVRTRELIRQGV